MKIAIDGTYGTGKTTLVEQISKNCGINKITNLEREIAEKIYFNFNNHTDSELEYFQNLLFKNQYLLEENMIDFITDSSCVLQEAYSNTEHGIITKYDFHFYLPIEFDLEDDKQRHISKKFQKQIDEKILFLYQKYHIPYRIIQGTIDERIEKIVSYINEKK